MDLPVEVERAADKLIEALRATEAFAEYERLRGEAMGDEMTRALLARFGRAESALRMAAAAGVQPRAEDAEEFERLSTLLYQSPEAGDYLLARMRAQRLAAEVMERLAQAADIGADISDI